MAHCDVSDAVTVYFSRDLNTHIECVYTIIIIIILCARRTRAVDHRIYTYGHTIDNHRIWTHGRRLAGDARTRQTRPERIWRCNLLRGNCSTTVHRTYSGTQYSDAAMDNDVIVIIITYNKVCRKGNRKTHSQVSCAFIHFNLEILRRKNI